MRQDIRLYIGGKEIEFNTNPKILFNYKITDVNNPTVVKNSYTKTIEVEGTPKNNDAFENIWNLERVQYAGIDFNPIKKSDFEIFVNGEIYEKGYAKLDGITTKNNKCIYSITLFGGLGSLFFNLTFNNSEGDDKKKLSDLNFAKRDFGTTFLQAEPDLNFRINKETIWDAWNTITGNPDAVYNEGEVNRPTNYLYDDKWEVVNFAPCYNGIPEDFEASRCIINKNNMPALQFSVEEDGTTYTDYLGYAMGEQPNDELTEWMTFDLRSYLQRPVVSMKRVIDACCNPINNGGYEIHLDSTFFNYDNPYYNNAYLTLPMLRENIEGGNIYTSTEGSIVYKSGALAGESMHMQHYIVDYSLPTISETTNVSLGLMLDLEVSGTPTLSAENLYMYKKLTSTPSKKGETERVSSIESISSVSVQLVAYDELDNVTASSNVYFITDVNAAGKANFDTNSLWYNSEVPVPGVTNLYGSFSKVENNVYRLVDGNNNPLVMGFNFKTSVPFKRLELKVLPVTYNDIYYKYPYKWWKGNEYNGIHRMEQLGRQLNLFAQPYVSYRTDMPINTALSAMSYEAAPELHIADFQLVSKDYSELFSNSMVNKENILNTDKTPAEYLLSYAKMFGLYFYSNPAEIADNPELAPNGVVHLLTRDTYYTGEIVDLEEVIDRNKGIKITPTTVDSKWFNWNVEQVESEANKEHKDIYGYDYGYQKVNTGYNFNTENKAMLDKVAYKGGVEVLETSKYYQLPTQGYPAYGENGFLYTLYNYSSDELKTLEVNDNFGTIFRNSINPNGWDDTDAFKKPQFHEADNKGIDGKNVLLFYTGGDFYSNSFNYWLTDDIEEMVSLNEGKPCWIMTVEQDDVNGRKIAYPINTLPIFQRNIVYSANGTIQHSWDMGNPFMTFVRDTYVGEQSSIYSKCWSDFVSDQYSQDNRKLNAYVVFDERPNGGMLRKFYWFNNCLWRMNAVKDWDIAELEPTAVEFIKVIDSDNYRLTPITNTNIASFTFPNLTNVDNEFGGNEREHYYRISSDAQDVTGVINVGNAGSWSFGDGAGAETQVVWTDGTYETYVYSDIMEPSNDYGTGDTIKVFSLTANTKSIERTWNFNILDNDDRSYIVHIIQSGMTVVDELQFTLSPSSVFFNAGGGQQIVLLENSNIDSYTVGNRPNWISLLNVSDAGFTLQAQPNTAGAIKNAAISVTGHKTGYSDITKYLQISQNIYSGSVSFDKSVVYVGKNVGDTSERVNITWNNITERTFTVTPNDRFRFTLLDGTAGFTITALKANTQVNSPITGSFTITCKDTNGNTITKSITIVQTS